MAKMINNRMIYLKTVRLSTTKVKLSRMMNIKIVIRTKKKILCLTIHSTQALVTLVKWNNHQTMKKLSTKKIRKIMQISTIVNKTLLTTMMSMVSQIQHPTIMLCKKRIKTNRKMMIWITTTKPNKKKTLGRKIRTKKTMLEVNKMRIMVRILPNLLNWAKG